MESHSANELAGLVNSFNFYSPGDQQAIAGVIEDYFTCREENEEEFDFGKCKFNSKYK